MNITDKQIKELKAKHGDIYQIDVDGKSCILRKPNRQDLSYVAQVKDPIKIAEAMLNSLWLEGDEEIKTNDEYFMAVSAKMDSLLVIKEAEVKKL